MCLTDLETVHAEMFFEDDSNLLWFGYFVKGTLLS